MTAINRRSDPRPQPKLPAPKPLIDVRRAVEKKFPKLTLPLFGDVFEGAKKEAVKAATVRAQHADEVTERAFVERLDRPPVGRELDAVKRKAEQLAVAGAPLADIVRYVDDAFEQLPEARALRASETLYREASRTLLDRAPSVDELRAAQRDARTMYQQGTTAADVRATYEAQIEGGAEYRLLHAEEPARAQYEAVLGRAPNDDELRAGTDEVRRLIGEGKTGDEVNAELVAQLQRTPEYLAAHPRGSEALRDAGRYQATTLNSHGACALGVNRAIEAATGIPRWGDANEIDDNLQRDRFQELNLPLEQALRIPGLVLTWEYSGNSPGGAVYGHTAITEGDGHTSYSDYVEHDTLEPSRNRTGLRVFQLLP